VKPGLSAKLAISYALLAMFLSMSMLLVSKYFLERQFQVYVTHKQDMRNDEIIGVVSKIFSGDEPRGDARAMLAGFGDSLIEQGIALMVYDARGELLYCPSMEYGNVCCHMLDEISSTSADACPEFDGAYTVADYEIQGGESPAGRVRIGYHGPVRYDEGDRVFMDGFSRAFLIMTAVFFAASAALGFLMAMRISGPIKRVIRRAAKISDGEYGGRVGIVTGTAEIDELSASVDHLAESLETQFMLKKRMAHAYSHEFRTPLTTLQTNLEAMIDGLWEPTTERLESLLSETARLSRMVSGIDDLVQAQVSEPDASVIKTADISEMAGRIVRGFESAANLKNVTLLHEKKPCFARIDPDKFSQVMVNLISNAVKYTNGGGNVTVRTFQNDRGAAIFSVEDDGIGISEADQPYIFEYLYRTDESRARGSGGSGIGLSVVSAVVEAHNGSISVRSEPGMGSVFTVELPG
jgi:signal transduction histidine kinase